ncbi:transposase domain-containing protein [Apostichopus japonicus]|uniref:Transposase domain-containing protein n=1 Tax=Stichopus japonicus TaxID=307972 RepID=A0A2G8JSI4_STIJA|nr:transposase domain-containing protein [Apostichopus japonicus]
MENAKDKRRKYKRKWISAARLLNTGRNHQTLRDEDYGASCSLGSTEELHSTASAEKQLENRATYSMFDCDGAQSLQADDISEHNNEKPTEPGPEQRYDDESESDECDSAEEGHSVGDGHSHHSTKLCTIEADLASWAVGYHVKHNAIDGLLKILQKSGHSCLPTTARSLLNSPRNVTSTIKSGMDYIYLGLKSELLKIVKCYALTNSTIDHVEISLNIDGLPLFKSANTSLWPILQGTK